MRSNEPGVPLKGKEGARTCSIKHGDIDVDRTSLERPSIKRQV